MYGFIIEYKKSLIFINIWGIITNIWGFIVILMCIDCGRMYNKR